jgi:hypothetical protein
MATCLSTEDRAVNRLRISPSKSGIVIFYPSRFLTDQICEWAQRHGGCQSFVSFQRAFPVIRRQIRRAALAVIDGSDDPAQAADTFLQAVGILGPDSTAIYVEKMHDGLELLVRSLGASLLLGPMSMEDWEGFLDHKFPTLIPLGPSIASMRRNKYESLQNDAENADNQIVYFRRSAG